MKRKVFLFSMLLVLMTSCYPTYLYNSIVNYHVVSVSVDSVSSHGKVNQYTGIIRINDKFYNAVLDEKLRIISIGEPVEINR